MLCMSAMLFSAIPLPTFAEEGVGAEPTPVSDISAVSTDGLLLHYTFEETSGTTVKDVSGHGNDGVLNGGTAWTAAGKSGRAVDLQGTNGYIGLPNGIASDSPNLTVATWVDVDSVKTWASVFALGTGTTNRIFLTLNDNGGATRLANMPQGGAENILTGPAFPTSKIWHHVAITIFGNTYTLYINGIQVASVSNMQANMTHLGQTTTNYIGRSQYPADPYFDGRIDDFRIYERALGSDEIMSLVTETMTDLEIVAYSKNWLDLGDTSEQTQNLTLPLIGPGGAAITWQSSDSSVIQTDGTVIRPGVGEGDRTVTLTAMIAKGTLQDTKEFKVTVWEENSFAYSLNINADEAQHEVSPTLYGVFYEDINYAADGGLYGELLQNRSFEFSTPLYSWTNAGFDGAIGTVTTAADHPLNTKNPRYARISVTEPGGGYGISNAGYTGLAVQSGERYNFTVYARSTDALTKPLQARLGTSATNIFAACELNGITSEWQKLGCSMESNTTVTNARLFVTTEDKAVVELDMVSLFPGKTYNNRDNGLRYDLAEMVDDLNPSFFRFPGGCIVEGGSIANRYQWKNTVGDVAERKVQPNQWASNYYQSFGLGFQEYFQYAQDIGAEPLPIIFIGQVSCSSNPPTVPVDQLQPYIQDALDLIEYANGDAKTTEWGAIRALHGHPEPFNLKYLGLGNELWGQNYFTRYEIFYNAIKAKYPDIKLVLSAGAFPEDANFNLTYEWLGKNNNKADLVDEHMYQSPQWFYNNVTRYDRYDRSGPKVFVGEYAAHGNGKRNNMESALAEAAFMTGLERNSDVVAMAAYAPLFAHQSYTQWTPDLIWFNNSQSFGTPNYYVQQLFAQHVGQYVMPSKLKKRNQTSDTITGSIVLGAWSTIAEYDDIRVTATDQTPLYDNDFSNSDTMTDWKTFKGTWAATGELLKQSESTTDARLELVQGKDWSNYTLELKARKVSGSEGFLIGFGAENSDDYYWWNLGGFSNSRTIVEKSVKGTKSTISNISYKTISTNQWYDIKIVVEGAHIRAYLDGELIHDITDIVIPGPLYSVTTKEAHTGELIVKTVNSSGSAQKARIQIAGAGIIGANATAIVLKDETLTAENSFANPTNVSPQTKIISGTGKEFDYDFPAYSVTVLRLPMNNSPIITSIEPTAITTKKGAIPQLPKVVRANLSDGSTRDASVNWRPVDAAQVAKTGSFEVRGTVEGTYLFAQAAVLVGNAEQHSGVMLTGPASAAREESFAVEYGLGDSGKEAAAHDITLTYDADKLTFDEAESLNENDMVIVGTESETPGLVRLLAVHLGEAKPQPNSSLLRFKFKAKQVSGLANVAITNAVIAASDGTESVLAGASLQVQINTIDKSALLALITQAQSVHDAASEGSGSGQYPVGSKAALQLAIDHASSVANDTTATQTEIEQAALQLNTALQLFKGLVIVTIPGDVNNDQRVSIADLAIIAKGYGLTSSDSGWELVKKNDLNGDNVIDIQDLVIVARQILKG